MAELDIANETSLSSFLWLAEWVDDGDNGYALELPTGTRLAVSLQSLDKHGNDSFTGVWVVFGVWSTAGQVKLPSGDVETINQTIIDYVFPRIITKDSGGMFSCMEDLVSVEFEDPFGKIITRDDGCVFDHIHVSQDLIDKYKSSLGV